MFDLIIRGGHVADWKNGIDGIADIAVSDGKIAEVGQVSGCAQREFDAQGRLVVPGIIDPHMHASSWLGGPRSYAMLASAGVTTAMEMAGPLDSVLQFVRENGSGINIGCLEQVRPGVNLPDSDPSAELLEKHCRGSLARGAYGVKLLGGHYPLTPAATARFIATAAKTGTFLAVHAGSTAHGSNIEGMEEVVALADGTPFHLAHINAYCRGAIAPVEDEIGRATALLEAHPEIGCESYMSPINGCSGKCTGGIPESGVTRNCLRQHGYPQTAEGLRQAIKDGAAMVHCEENGITVLADSRRGYQAWLQTGTDMPMSFRVNPPLPLFYFATARRRDGRFLVPSLCTDGGGIPRNVIVASGLSLVRFGALSLTEFVRKSSYAAAQYLGLPSKGHFTPGADADITVIDFNAQKATDSFCLGKPVLSEGRVVGTSGRIITTPAGTEAVLKAGLSPVTVDVPALLESRR